MTVPDDEAKVGSVSWQHPRRLAVFGLLAIGGGLVVRVGLAAALGSGLNDLYTASVVGSNLFYGSVIVIGTGAIIALATSRSSGVALMFLAALFDVGVSIGSVIAFTLMVPSHPGDL